MNIHINITHTHALSMYTHVNKHIFTHKEQIYIYIYDDIYIYTHASQIVITGIFQSQCKSNGDSRYPSELNLISPHEFIWIHIVDGEKPILFL